MNEPEKLPKKLQGVEDDVRLCMGCERKLPLGKIYWDRDFHGPQGYSLACKECRAKAKHEKRIMADASLARRMRERVVDTMLAGDVSVVAPAMDEITQEILSNFKGGIRGFVADMVADYRSCLPGTPVRQKTMQMMVSIITKAAEARPTLAIENMTDEELNKAIERRLSEQLNKALKDPGNAGPERITIESEAVDPPPVGGQAEE